MSVGVAGELERLPDVLGRAGAMALLLEEVNEELAVEGVVVDDEDRRACRSHERPPSDMVVNVVAGRQPAPRRRQAQACRPKASRA
jgi:hypothetical protein